MKAVVQQGVVGIEPAAGDALALERQGALPQGRVADAVARPAHEGPVDLAKHPRPRSRADKGPLVMAGMARQRVGEDLAVAEPAHDLPGAREVPLPHQEVAVGHGPDRPALLEHQRVGHALERDDLDAGPTHGFCQPAELLEPGRPQRRALEQGPPAAPRLLGAQDLLLHARRPGQGLEASPLCTRDPRPQERLAQQTEVLGPAFRHDAVNMHRGRKMFKGRADGCFSSGRTDVFGPPRSAHLERGYRARTAGKLSAMRRSNFSTFLSIHMRIICTVDA
jgi:hypothetical protein